MPDTDYTFYAKLETGEEETESASEMTHLDLRELSCPLPGTLGELKVKLERGT